jgi:eukaryotic-like serine/threonine-protein kinase
MRIAIRNSLIRREDSATTRVRGDTSCATFHVQGRHRPARGAIDATMGMNTMPVPGNVRFAAETQTPTSSAIPSELLEKAGTRFSWLAILCAGMTTVMHLLANATVSTLTDAQAAHTTADIANWLIVAISVLFVIVQRTGFVSPIGMLRGGLVYQVVIAFLLATIQFCHPGSGLETTGGPSWVSTWIIVCGLTVPSTLATSLSVNFATALSHLGAYGFSLWLHDYAPLPWQIALLVFLPTFLVAGWTTLLNQRIYTLVKEAAQAKQLGSYTLEEMLGKGGMGEVWRASHRMLARQAAVKLIRPEMLISQTGRQASLLRRRFEQEARATASLQSPHTVELYDFGVAENGSFYYVMELLDGVDLDRLVKQHGPQSPGRVIWILRQVCRSLAEAHHAGLVHRDIKPSNILLTRLGIEFDFVKVLDFGLVKRQMLDDETPMTIDGTTAGTPAFMAPEMARGDQDVDGRADLYAVGYLGYWLLTGQLVFEEKGAVAMIMAHMQNKPAPPSSRVELPIPADLDAAILKCLEKDPAKRPQSAGELIALLDRCAVSREWSETRAADWWSTNRPSAQPPVPAAAMATTK